MAQSAPGRRGILRLQPRIPPSEAFADRAEGAWEAPPTVAQTLCRKVWTGQTDVMAAERCSIPGREDRSGIGGADLARDKRARVGPGRPGFIVAFEGLPEPWRSVCGRQRAGRLVESGVSLQRVRTLRLAVRKLSFDHGFLPTAAISAPPGIFIGYPGLHCWSSPKYWRRRYPQLIGEMIYVDASDDEQSGQIAG